MACDYAEILAYNVALRQQLAQLSLEEQVSALYCIVAALAKSLDPNAVVDPIVLLKLEPCLRCIPMADMIVVIGAICCGPYSDLEPPRITDEPDDVTIPEGEAWNMFVVAEGSTPLRYQWRYSGVPIPGANSPVYTMSNTPLGAAGIYDVIVSNTVGQVQSRPAKLTVIGIHGPPVIIRHPLDVQVMVGEAASFDVIAQGSAPLSYQWYFNGALIPGATGVSYAIGQTDPLDAGNYSVKVSNPWGSVTSNPGRLTVISPTTFTVWLGNGGQNAPASYTSADIINLDNAAPYSNQSRRSSLGGTYEINGTSSNLNEYQVIAIPTNVMTGPPVFTMGGFPLPMNKVQEGLVINGTSYTVYRTSGRSLGPFTVEQQTAIIIS